MEIPEESASTLARDLLVQEITNLKSLLRLNADGVGDDADLVHQLNQTRGAIDQFSASLAQKRDLLLTPDSIALASPSSSSNNTSPRLSLDSLPSWRSSRTSQLSLSINGEISRKLGEINDGASEGMSGDSAGQGAQLNPSGLGDEEVQEEEEGWRVQMGLGLDALRRTLRDRHGVGNMDGGEHEMQNGEEVDGEGNLEGEEQGDEESEIQDETFKRLSLLLASLQAQAEAAVSNPTTPFQDGGPQDDNTIPGSEEGFQFPIRSSSSSPLPRFRKFPILQSSDSASSTSVTSRPLFRNAFRRSKSLPYAAFSCGGSGHTASLSSIPDVESTSRSTHKVQISPVGSGGTADESSNVESFTNTSSSPTLLSPDCHNSSDSGPRPNMLPRRSTSASVTSNKEARWPNTPPLSGTLSPGLNPMSGCSSRRSSMSLSRRSSSMIRDMGLETLIGDIIEAATKAAEREHDLGWVWALLAGGGVLWFAIGWALKWNCECVAAGCGVAGGG